jgi:hypothetical protein
VEHNENRWRPDFKKETRMKYLSILLLLFMLLSACSNLPPAAPEMPASTSAPSYPNEPSYPNQPTAGAPGSQPYAHQPGDEALERGEVFLDSSEVLVMESYPVQIMLTLKGSLPTPCHQLRIKTNPPDVKNRIQVEAYSVVDPAQICTQVLQPFEANLGLGSFPSGHYSVWVNGEMVGEFDA